MQLLTQFRSQKQGQKLEPISADEFSAGAETVLRRTLLSDDKVRFNCPKIPLVRRALLAYFSFWADKQVCISTSASTPPLICTWSVWMKEYVWNQEICMFATFSSQGQRWQWGTWLFWYTPGSLGNASILFWLRDEVGRHFVPKRAWIFTLVKQKERWNYSWLSI